jgi:hypothetical protein
MKIQMKVVMSGTRNGESWPLPGGELEVPDEEGANMCANGLAIPVSRKDRGVETRAETEVDVTPESPRVNKADANKSARAAERRAEKIEKAK